MDAATVVSLTTLATLVFTAVWQYFRDSRARVWAQQDKLELAKATTDISTKITENTDISTKAFHEANTVNLKLEKLGLTHDKDIKTLIAKSDVRNGAVRELVQEVRTDQKERKKADDVKVVDGLKKDIAGLKSDLEKKK